MTNERTLKLTVLGDAKKALQSLGKVESKLGKFGGALKKAAKVAAAFTVAAGAAIVGALALSVRSFTQTGDAIHKMSLRTGVGTEVLSELAHAAELSGSSIETVEKAIKKQASTLEDAKDGLSTVVIAYDKLGLSVEDLEKLSPEELFNEHLKALAGVEDATQRAALAQDIFGKSGIDLLPMLSDGAAGLAEMRAEAHQLGVVFSEEDAVAAAEFNDNMQRLNARVTKFKMDIVRVVLPVLIRFQQWLGPRLSAAGELARAKMQELGKWFDENRDQIRQFFEQVREVAIKLFDNFKIGLEVIGPLLFRFGKWILDNRPALVVAIAAVGAIIAIALGPASLAIIAILGVITAVGYLKENWEEVLAFIEKKIDQFVAFITSPRGLKALMIFLGPGGVIIAAAINFRDEIKEVIDFIIDKIKKLVTMIQSIPKPDLGFIGDLAGAAGSAFGGARDRLRGFSGIPGFAHGGVVPGPVGAPRLAMVHGGETVLPVGRGSAGPPNVHVYIGGREIRDLVVETLVGLERTGRISQVTL